MKTIDVKRGYFRTFDGLKIFYTIEGNDISKDSLPPILFCYGLACSKDQWKYQIDFFKKDRKIIYFDYRGHRSSEMPENKSQVTIENIAKDIESLLQELKINKVILAGHSMGVNVVLAAHDLIENKIAGLVLANGSIRSPLDSVFNSSITYSILEQCKTGYFKFPEIANKLWKFPHRLPFFSNIIAALGFDYKFIKLKDVSNYLKVISKIDLGVVITLLEDYSKNNCSIYLDKIKCPTLIIAGEKDKITPLENQKIIHQLVKHSELYVVKRGSHCSQLDIPDLINLKVEGFLKENGI